MNNKTGLSNFVALSKDIISLLRDAGLILIVFVMILYPFQFKSFLTDIGIQRAFGLEFDLDSFDKLETAQVLISNLQSKNDDLVKALEDIEGKVNDSDFKSKVQNFSKNNIEQRQKTKSVQRDVSKILEYNTPFVEKELSQSKSSISNSNSEYTVGLQTFGMQDAERKKINNSLKLKDYNLDKITSSYSGEKRPSWFSQHSTVFYYAASAKSSAEKLSKFLSSITNDNFEVKRGAGLGVDPERKNTTLFVHYIKS